MVLNINKKLLLEGVQEIHEDAFSEQHPIASKILNVKKWFDDKFGNTPKTVEPGEDISNSVSQQETPGFIDKIGRALIPGHMNHNQQLEDLLNSK